MSLKGTSVARQGFWSVPERWPGETLFIIGGGPSVLGQPVERLEGRRVMVVNTSFRIAPWADYLVFSDTKWWDEYRSEVKRVFRGEVINVSPKPYPDCEQLRMRRCPNVCHMTTERDLIMVQYTSMSPALMIGARLVGNGRIVTVGVDQQNGPDGRMHHHAAYPWRIVMAWNEQSKELQACSAMIMTWGLSQIINASPGSAFKQWPITSLTEYLQTEQPLAKAS